MVNDAFYIKPGEQFTSGPFTLYGKDGEVQNLPAGSVIKLHVKERETGIILFSNKLCAISGAEADGQVTVSFLSAETENEPEGYYVGEFETIFQNGDRLFFPDDRKGFLIILSERATG